MTTYSDILDACKREGIGIHDVDRILLNADTVEEFREMTEGTNIDTSDYATIQGPAVRTIDGPERLVYVNEAGYEVEVELSE